MPDSTQEGVHVARMESSPERALERVSAAAESWGGEWRPEGERTGRLILPVSAGVRRGWMGFVVTASSRTSEGDEGSRLELRRAEEHLVVDRGAVVLLLTALFGALLCLVAPLIHRLLPLMPIGFVLMVAGWLFVAARLRNSGPEEFLEFLDGHLDGGLDGGPEAEGAS